MPKAPPMSRARRVPAAARPAARPLAAVPVRRAVDTHPAPAAEGRAIVPGFALALRAVALAAVLLLPAGPARAQAPVQAKDYRPNAALGQALAKKPFIETKTNPGGKGILDNSCIYKESFSLSPSEVVLDHCDVAGATAKFTGQYGPPEQASDADGGKKLLVYRLLHNENSYLVKIYIECSQGKTEQFALVECKNEKNRAKPGRPPDERPFWKKLSPF
ncbi:MAG: hypothetical protein ACLGQH_14465 [Acidobacteriota bacterium]